MNDDDAPTTSADQDAWTALADALRSELAKQIPLMGAMKPDEIKTLVEAADSAMWMRIRAGLFDKRIELERNKLFAD